MATPVKGVESLEFAPITGIGTMPTTGWENLIDIAMETVTFDIPEATTNDIRVEDKPGIRYVLPGESEPATFAAGSIDIDGAKLASLFGGTWNAGTQTFTAPAQEQVVYKAIRLTSQEFFGKKFQLFMPQAAITVNFSTAFTKNNLVTVSLSARATTPVDGSGNPVSPWGYQLIDVPPTT